MTKSSIFLRIVVAIAICLAANFSAFAQTSVWDGTHTIWTKGNGTQTDPYLLETAQQLAYLAYYVNQGTEAVNYVVGSNTYWKLTADVDLNSLPWTPIGFYKSNTNQSLFGGHFDGSGHTVANLQINGEHSAGLFARMNGGSIRNIGIVGVSSIAGTASAGGIVGWTTGTIIIENCYNTGSVSSSGSSGGIVAGGIVGCVNDGDVIISNCYNTGNIYSVTSVYDYSSSGGIVGYTVKGTLTIENCYNTGDVSSSSYSISSYSGGTVGCTANGTLTIENCYNTGDVSAKYRSGGIVGCDDNNSDITIKDCYNTGDVSSNYYSGGIVGYDYGTLTIENCYNTGDVSSEDSSGGIVGISYSKTLIIENCYNAGNISSVHDYSSSGGIVGHIRSTSNKERTLIIENCYNTGDVSSSFSGYYRYSYSGGIVGYTEGTLTIENCYNTGDISSSIGKSSYSGGIIGYGGDGDGEITLIIENCYNTGDVSSNRDYYTYSGGIVGYSREKVTTIIENCYNTGDVSSYYSGGIVGIVNASGFVTIDNCYNVGDVSSEDYSGGIVGMVDASGFVTINNCYNVGDIFSSNSYSGGIMGMATYINNKVYNCYCLLGSAYSSGGGTSQTEEFMKTQDFVNLLNDGPEPNSAYKLDDIFINNGYPILMWQTSENTVTLSSLTVSEGELTPTFKSNIFNYTVNVENSITSITITATPTDTDATVIGDGEKQLALGANPFTITVTAADGITKSNYTLTVNRTGVGIDEVGTDNYPSVRVYPNPTRGELIIEMGDMGYGICDIEIFDVMGRRHECTNARRHEGEKFPSFGGAGVVLDISHLPTGIYFLRIQTENGVVTKKVIKQ